MSQTWLKLYNDPSQFRTFLLREHVIDAIRSYFKGDGFLEVETPLMVKAPGMEPYLEVFESALQDPQGNEQQTFLITSPEYAMKKLLVAGLPRIFQICKCFRNGEDLRSSSHNPEFTMIEWYRIESDYQDIMTDCEGMVCAIFDYLYGKQFELAVRGEKVVLGFPHLVKRDGKRVLVYQGKEVVLDAPWERISVAQAFEKYVGVHEEFLQNSEEMRRIGREKGYQMEDDTTWEQVFHQIFLNEIEHHLGAVSPTILYDYPASMAALSRKKPGDERYAERFEFYILGKELGNAFSELTDPTEQENRLRAEWQERKELGKKMYDVDEDFIHALQVGMPEAAGIAVGIDRLVMLFANAETIQETLWFPAHEMF